MKIIALITQNKKLAHLEPKIHLKNFQLLIFSQINQVETYIQEYMPQYIIVSSKIEEYKRIKEYIQHNTGSEMIISGQTKSSGVGIHVNEIHDENDLLRILRLIDRLDDNKKHYKVINQQVTSLYSVQGGVGKTSIAFNLAYLLSRMEKVKVLLIDFNFCEGQADLAGRLKIPMVPNLSVFMQRLKDSPNSLWDSIICINKLNIDVLQPPLSVEQCDGFDLDMLYEVIYSCRKKYGYIICDLPNRFDNHVLETLNLSTRAFFILSPEVFALHRINRICKLLPENQQQFAIINNIANKSFRKDELSQSLHIPLKGEISYLQDRRSLHGFLNMQSQLSDLKEMII